MLELVGPQRAGAITLQSAPCRRLQSVSEGSGVVARTVDLPVLIGELGLHLLGDLGEDFSWTSRYARTSRKEFMPRGRASGSATRIKFLRDLPRTSPQLDAGFLPGPRVARSNVACVYRAFLSWSARPFPLGGACGSVLGTTDGGGGTAGGTSRSRGRRGCEGRQRRCRWHRAGVRAAAISAELSTPTPFQPRRAATSTPAANVSSWSAPPSLPVS